MARKRSKKSTDVETGAMDADFDGAPDVNDVPHGSYDISDPSIGGTDEIILDTTMRPSTLQAADAPPQPSYLGPLLVTLFCCVPLGFISIIYAIQVPIRWRRGDHAGARYSAERAEFWMYASVGAQVVIGIVGALYWFFSYRHRPYYG